MTTTDPAAMLRAASEKLRELAEAATPGPWRVEPDYGITAGPRGYDDVLTPGPVSCGRYCYGGTSVVDVTDTDAAYIAAMSPPVALALADWLAKEATIWVGVAEPGKKVVWENGEWEVTVPLSSQPEALAVAEAILGPGWAFRRAEQHLRTADQPQEES